MKKLIAMAMVACCAFFGGSLFASADTVPVDKYYISTDSPLVWEESNGCAGLQTEASNCDTSDEDLEDADDKIA